MSVVSLFNTKKSKPSKKDIELMYRKHYITDAAYVNELNKKPVSMVQGIVSWDEPVHSSTKLAQGGDE